MAGLSQYVNAKSSRCSIVRRIQNELLSRRTLVEAGNICASNSHLGHIPVPTCPRGCDGLHFTTLILKSLKHDIPFIFPYMRWMDRAVGQETTCENCLNPTHLKTTSSVSVLNLHFVIMFVLNLSRFLPLTRHSYNINTSSARTIAYFLNNLIYYLKEIKQSASRIAQSFLTQH